MKQFATFLSFITLAAMLAPLQSMASDTIDMNAAAKPTDKLFASALKDSELETFRGGSSPTVMTSSLNATLNGNTNIGGVSGANSISDGALNNVSGLTSVIQNSGNNVIIQSSFQVNVNFQ